MTFSTVFWGKTDIKPSASQYTHRKLLVVGCLYSAASLASVKARIRVPSAIASGLEYSSGRCDTPARQGMKIIAIGATRAMKLESW